MELKVLAKVVRYVSVVIKPPLRTFSREQVRANFLVISKENRIEHLLDFNSFIDDNLIATLEFVLDK